MGGGNPNRVGEDELDLPDVAGCGRIPAAPSSRPPLRRSFLQRAALGRPRDVVVFEVSAPRACSKDEGLHQGPFRLNGMHQIVTSPFMQQLLEGYFSEFAVARGANRVGRLKPGQEIQTFRAKMVEFICDFYRRKS